jgi:hypothetical protein
VNFLCDSCEIPAFPQGAQDTKCGTAAANNETLPWNNLNHQVERGVIFLVV